MAVLTLDVGVSNLSVVCQRGGHAAPRKVGNRGYAFAGPETSGVRAELMVVPVILSLYSPTVANTIKALFANGAQVACSGDVFNNGGATIVCSAEITDELHSSDAWWELSLTLYAVAASPYTPPTTVFLLTGAILTGSTYAATPDASYPGDTLRNFNALNAATLATCGSGTCAVTSSATPERTWLSVPLDPGVLYGSPTVRFETDMTGTYSGTTIYAVMQSCIKLYHVRSGVDLAGPFTSGYVGPSLSGGDVTTTIAETIVLGLHAGDQIRIEIWSRLALQPTKSDVPQRQRIYHGVVPGPRHPAILTVNGTVTSL